MHASARLLRSVLWFPFLVSALMLGAASLTPGDRTDAATTIGEQGPAASPGEPGSPLVRALAWDQAAQRWINRHHHPIADWVLRGVSAIGDGGAVWILTGLALLIFGRGSARITGALLLGAMLVADRLIGAPLGWLSHRTRPYLADPAIRHLGAAWAGSSFPSAHAHSVVIATILLGSQYRRTVPALCLFALLTLYSRPYLGMHYPLDTLGGAAIGLAVGLAARRVALLWQAEARRRSNEQEPGPRGPA